MNKKTDQWNGIQNPEIDLAGYDKGYTMNEGLSFLIGSSGIRRN